MRAQSTGSPGTRPARSCDCSRRKWPRDGKSWSNAPADISASSGRSRTSPCEPGIVSRWPTPDGILVRREGRDAQQSDYESNGISLGSCWDERIAGTNGVSMAIAQQSAFTVRGHEHYFSKFAPFACTGAPLRDARERNDRRRQSRHCRSRERSGLPVRKAVAEHRLEPDSARPLRTALQGHDARHRVVTDDRRRAAQQRTSRRR